MTQQLHLVTGAFGYTGKYIAARLLKEGVRVRTLTNSPNRANPFGGQVEALPYTFDDFDKLVESMRGATVLYNNYWVRFNHKEFQHSEAVENTLKMIAAAKQAGRRALCSRQHYQSIRGFQPDVLCRQSPARTRAHRVRFVVRDSATDGYLRRRRYSHQQYRVDAETLASVRRLWRWQVSLATHFRR